jgi:hypothetical protein
MDIPSIFTYNCRAVEEFAIMYWFPWRRNWDQCLHPGAQLGFLQVHQCCGLAVCIHCCHMVQEVEKENSLCNPKWHQQFPHRLLGCLVRSPFSPDLLHSNFYVCWSLKNHFKGKYYWHDEMKAEMHQPIFFSMESYIRCIAGTDTLSSLAVTWRNSVPAHYSLLFWISLLKYKYGCNILLNVIEQPTCLMI